MAAHRVVIVVVGLTAPRPRRDPHARPRVVILLGHAWGMGGTTRTCLQVAARLAEHQHVTVLSIVRRRDTPYFTFPAGVEVIAADDQRVGGGVLAALPTVLFLPRDRRMSRWATLRSDLMTIRALRRLRPDVVMGTRPALNVLAARLARRGTVAIGQEHINLASHRQELRREIERGYRGLGVLVTLTEDDRAAYAASLGSVARVRCIPNAVPALPGPMADPDARAIIAIGRLAPQKGFDRLIPAFAEVVRHHPDWTLRICGAGRGRRRLERLISEHELDDHVLLLGAVARVEEQLARCSIFVLSSRFEGLPMAMIEAMSKGLAVVAFDCPTGPRDVLDDGRAGVLVPNGDIEGLAQAMLEVVGDGSRRRQLGAAAAARAEGYSMKEVGPRWDDLLRDVIPPAVPVAAALGRSRAGAGAADARGARPGEPPPRGRPRAGSGRAS